jgi:hypothetical protein
MTSSVKCPTKLLSTYSLFSITTASKLHVASIAGGGMVIKPLILELISMLDLKGQQL